MALPNSNRNNYYQTNPTTSQRNTAAAVTNKNPMPPPRGYISSRSNPNPRGVGGIRGSSFSSYGGSPITSCMRDYNNHHPAPHPPPLLLLPHHHTTNFNNTPLSTDHPILVPAPLSSSSSPFLQTVPSPAPVPDSNGYKDPRSKEDSFVTVRDRKVRVSASSSLYAACRSWLRNGVSEETQPHYLDGIKLLPKPSPPPVPDAHSPAEPTKEEEEEESIEHLSPKDLLKRHVKRAKKVRARLRDERLQRIARYKTRLALLLPPLVEQQHQFRNESAAGN